MMKPEPALSQLSAMTENLKIWQRFELQLNRAKILRLKVFSKIQIQVNVNDLVLIYADPVDRC